MGKCVSKAKKIDANDVPCITALNIVADNMCIGSRNMIKINDNMFQNSNIEDIRAKVCKQELLTKVYVPTDECTDGQIVTSSKALNQEPFNAEKEINKLCKEETDARASSCQTMTEKLKTGSTLPKQTGTSSSHGSSTDASSCQTLTEKFKADSTLSKQTGTISSHGSSSTGRLEQDGSVFVDLSQLSSEGSNDSTIQCDINRCSSPTNDVDKLKDYTIVNKRLDIESSTTNSQLFGPNMTSITTEGLLRNSENSPITEHQSSVNPGNCRTEDNERNSVGDGEVGENQEEEQEHQEVEENQGEVTQAGEDQEEEHQEQENQAEDQEQENQAGDQGVEHQEEENQTGENQQEEHQEEDLEVEEDSEPSHEPAIIDDISVGNNNNLNDQQLKEKNTSCDVMETIKMLTNGVGQYSMNKNFDIAMTGNDEVKIENGKVIGSTARSVSCAIKDIAIQSMKVQQSF